MTSSNLKWPYEDHRPKLATGSSTVASHKSVHDKIPDLMRKWGIWFFSHCLIMWRSQNWPDLRSQKSKNPRWHFVATECHLGFFDFCFLRSGQFWSYNILGLVLRFGLIISYKFHIDRSKTVATVKSQTWVTWPDLVTWPEMTRQRNF